MFIGGTHPTTPPKPTMSQIAALETQVINLQQSMDTIQTAMDALTAQIKTLTEAEEFDIFIQQELTPYFGEKTSRNIIKVLQKCRTEDHNICTSPLFISGRVLKVISKSVSC